MKKQFDGFGFRPYAVRMKIGIDWKDLEDIVIEGGMSCDAYVQSAYHKVWDRELNDDELDYVTSEFGTKMYELSFDRAY